MTKMTAVQEDALPRETISLDIKFVQLRSFENFQVTVDRNTTVTDLQCEVELLSGIPADLIQLYHNGERVVGCFSSVLQTKGLTKDNIVVAKMSQDWEYFIKTCIKSENYQAVRRRSRVKMQVLSQEDRIFVASFVAARHSNSALLFGILPCNKSITRTTELSRRNILHAAVHSGDKNSIVNILMNGGGSLIDMEDINGETPLSMAKNMADIADMLKAYHMIVKQNSMEIQYGQCFEYQGDSFESSDGEKEDTQERTSSSSSNDVTTTHDVTTTNSDIITHSDDFTTSNDISKSNDVTMIDDVTTIYDTASSLCNVGKVDRNENFNEKDFINKLVSCGRNKHGRENEKSGLEKTNDESNGTFDLCTDKSEVKSSITLQVEPACPKTTRRNRKNSDSYLRRRKMGMPSLLMSGKSPIVTETSSSVSQSSSSSQLFSSPTSQLLPSHCLTQTSSLHPSASFPQFSSLQQPSQQSFLFPSYAMSSSLPTSYSLTQSSLIQQPFSFQQSSSLQQPSQQSFLSPSYATSSSLPTSCSLTQSSLIHQPSSFPQSFSSLASHPTSSVVTTSQTSIFMQTSSLSQPPNLRQTSSPHQSSSLPHPYSSFLQSTSVHPQSHLLQLSSSISKSSSSPLTSVSYSHSSPLPTSKVHDSQSPAHKEMSNDERTTAGKEPLSPKPPTSPVPDRRRVAHVKHLDVKDDRSSPAARRRSSSTPYALDPRLLQRATTRTRVLSESSAEDKAKQDSFQAWLGTKREQTRNNPLIPKEKERRLSSENAIKKEQEKNNSLSITKDTESYKSLSIPKQRERRLSLGNIKKRDQKGNNALPIPNEKERRLSLGNLLREPSKNERKFSTSTATSQRDKSKASSVGSSEAFKTWLHKKDGEAFEKEINLLSHVISSERKILRKREEILTHLKSAKRSSKAHKN